MKLCAVFADRTNKECFRTACQLVVLAPAIAVDFVIGAKGYVGMPALLVAGRYGSNISDAVQCYLVRKFG